MPWTDGWSKRRYWQQPWSPPKLRPDAFELMITMTPVPGAAGGWSKRGACTNDGSTVKRRRKWD